MAGKRDEERKDQIRNKWLDSLRLMDGRREEGERRVVLSSLGSRCCSTGSPCCAADVEEEWVR